MTCSLYEVASFDNGGAFRESDFVSPGDGLPVVKIAELKAGVTKQTQHARAASTRTVEIDAGDVLLSWSGNPDTSLGTYVWPGGPALLNQHIFRVRFASPAERSWGVLLLRQLQPQLAEIARDKQTTGLGHFTVADMKRIRVWRPTATELVTLHERVGPMLAQAHARDRESRTLADLRDALMPRLLSGTLTVRDAEKVVFEAGA